MQFQFVFIRISLALSLSLSPTHAPFFLENFLHLQAKSIAQSHTHIQDWSPFRFQTWKTIKPLCLLHDKHESERFLSLSLNWDYTMKMFDGKRINETAQSKLYSIAYTRRKREEEKTLKRFAKCWFIYTFERRERYIYMWVCMCMCMVSKETNKQIITEKIEITKKNNNCV